MKKFQVVIVKPVTDYLRAFVEVEAESAEAAEAKALEDLDDIEFSFWCSGDCMESMTVEATELQVVP